MGARVNFVDTLYQQGRILSQETYTKWRGYAEFLDNYKLEFTDVGAVITEVNADYDREVFADHDTYLAIYNMMLGKPYDPLPANDGEAFITNEDYESGEVVITVVDPTYQGPFEDLSFAASGPPGMFSLIRATINATLQANGASLLSIDMLETNTQRLWNLPIYSNYKIRAFYHGSPIAPMLIVLILAALAAIFLTVLVWRVGSAVEMQQKTKQTEATTSVIRDLNTTLQDPNVPEDVKRAIADAIAKALPSLTKALNIPPAKSIVEQASDLLTKVAIIGGIGLGVFVLIQFLPTITGSIQRSQARSRG